MRTPVDELAGFFGVEEMPELMPRYNIAPTQPVATVLVLTGDRRFGLMRWGLIPPWAKDPSIGGRMINARSETVAQKPAFRSAFRHRRCLVMADGFYEWQRRGSLKQPYYIVSRDRSPLGRDTTGAAHQGDEIGSPNPAESAYRVELVSACRD